MQAVLDRLIVDHFCGSLPHLSSEDGHRSTFRQVVFFIPDDG